MTGLLVEDEKWGSYDVIKLTIQLYPQKKEAKLEKLKITF